MRILLQITRLTARVVPNGKSSISKLCLQEYLLVWGHLPPGSLTRWLCTEGVQHSQGLGGSGVAAGKNSKLTCLLEKANSTKLVLLHTEYPSVTCACLHALNKRLLCACMGQVLCLVLGYRARKNRHGLCVWSLHQAVVMQDEGAHRWVQKRSHEKDAKESCMVLWVGMGGWWFTSSEVRGDSDRSWAMKDRKEGRKKQGRGSITLATTNNDVIIKYQQKVR